MKEEVEEEAGQPCLYQILLALFDLRSRWTKYLKGSHHIKKLIICGHCLQRGWGVLTNSTHFGNDFVRCMEL